MHLPLLIEDLLDECEILALNKDYNALIEYVEENYKRLDDPLLNNPEVHQKLQALYSYIVQMKKIPETRIIKRLENIPGMINRFRKQHLVWKVSKNELSKPLNTPIKYIKGVGPKRAVKLQKLNIEILENLINFFPRDFEDRRKVIPIPLLRENEKVTTVGKVISIEKVKKSGFSIISAVISDGLYQILLKWFNQDYMENLLKVLKNKEVYATGLVKKGYYGALEIHNPDIEVNDNTKREILPLYPLTEGLNQKTLRNIIRENLPSIYYYDEILPEEIKEKRKLISIYEAYTGMHFPKSMYHFKQSRFRLAYEEILTLQIAFLLTKLKTKEIGGIPKRFDGKLSKKFLQSLPFKLTSAQQRVYNEIKNDLKSDKPMNRLLQGDVGSGKTIVAELAILDNFEAGYQAAIMAPTSILAIQHYKKMFEDLSALGLRIALLIGATSRQEKERIKSGLKDGTINVVIGTHALIQEDVHFKNLGLVIIDEQHRFGVKQREELMSKGHLVDTLVMTATPIPRTLSLALYGDLDVSIIDEMPPGRKTIKTFLVHQSKLDEVYNFVKSEIENGGQAYIVYPLIDESDKLSVKAATTMYEHLSKNIFNGIPIGLIHGKLSDSEKDEIMYQFAKGKLKILVSTTVIEVGIDVPNATIMVIENAERFGLAQLHQLRGRVGRGEKQSYCYLTVGDIPRETWDRLSFFASTNDGFKISEYDLKLRGPGEFLGIRQHGLPEFRVADIIRDTDIMLIAREDAEKIVETPEKYKHIIEKVRQLHKDRLKLLEVG
ncbi:ATP-dependent DNA helicase RecG [Thermosipho ferrireducens]|uniref:ATP-dependent DNA helicase RecG n=1 Tax=Thermosipho ferrireducens TaxID=2571116 RepID=A0ABX7SBK4_9BACT|nr:ATP-dependent DNA helicase RecG [Thermosipho ferrireducens]QTA38943.1 ATP-dependent DNA helicase RecG [Thermosipho ferrireducens]